MSAPVHDVEDVLYGQLGFAFSRQVDLEVPYVHRHQTGLVCRYSHILALSEPPDRIDLGVVDGLKVLVSLSYLDGTMTGRILQKNLVEAVVDEHDRLRLLLVHEFLDVQARTDRSCNQSLLACVDVQNLDR